MVRLWAITIALMLLPDLAMFHFKQENFRLALSEFTEAQVGRVQSAAIRSRHAAVHVGDCR